MYPDLKNYETLSPMQRFRIPSTSYLKVIKWFESKTASSPSASAEGSNRTSGRPATGPSSDMRRSPQHQGLKGGISNKCKGETCVRRIMSGTESRSPPLEKHVGLDEEAVGIFDKLKGPVRVKKILRRGQDDPLEQVRRPWYRVKHRECPKNILALARKHYKVFADIGPTVGLMSRVLPVLDTGAGSNLIRKSELPAGLETFVSFGPTQDIGDANKRPLRTVGTINMPVGLERFMATAELFVCEKLAVPLIIGAYYYDRCVEAIYPRKKTVEFAGFSKVPIVRRFSSRKRNRNIAPGEDENDERKGERISPKLKVARATTIEPGTQRVVECTSKRSGLIVVQPYSSFYENHGLICTNGVVLVERDRPFRLLAETF